VEAIRAASAAGDHGGVHAVADQRHVPRVLSQDDELLVQTFLDVNDVPLVALEWRGSDGSAHGRVVAAAIRGHHHVDGNSRHWSF